MSKCRIAGTVNGSIVDGPGMRFTVFFQGCKRGCKGCHNRHTWDPMGGMETTVEAIIKQIKSNPLIAGLSLSGGEPFLQIGAACELADYAHSRGLSVWCWTGYKYEDLLRSPDHKRLLDRVDVLIDGEYMEAFRTMVLPWRGSANQRVIDLRSGEIT